LVLPFSSSFLLQAMAVSAQGEMIAVSAKRRLYVWTAADGKIKK
jgi:hypothetical protein